MRHTLLISCSLALVTWAAPGPTSSYGRASDSTAQINPSLGKEKETSQYWDEFNTIFSSGRGFEVFHRRAWTGELEVADIKAIFADVVTEERSRTAQVAALPVLNVAPEVTAYAAKYARTRAQLAAVCEDLVGLENEAEAVVSLPNIGLGLLSHLPEAEHDKNFGILGSLLLNLASQTSTELLALKPEAKALAHKAKEVRDNFVRLSTDEIPLRSILAQRFDREFPSYQTYLSEAQAAEADARLSKGQLKKTLIGTSIGQWPNQWTFDSVKEFVSFQVLKVTKRSDVLTDYEVLTHVKGIRSGQEHDFLLRLTYASLYTRSKLVRVDQLRIEETGSDRD